MIVSRFIPSRAALTLAALVLLGWWGVPRTVARAGGAPARINCGSIVTRARNGNQYFAEQGPAARVRQAEQCFVTAYRRCTTATLSFTQHGVDTIETHQLAVVKRNGRCAVQDQAAFRIFPSPVIHKSSYLCARVTLVHTDFRLVSCQSEGDLLISA